MRTTLLTTALAAALIAAQPAQACHPEGGGCNAAPDWAMAEFDRLDGKREEAMIAHGRALREANRYARSLPADPRQYTTQQRQTMRDLTGRARALGAVARFFDRRVFELMTSAGLDENGDFADADGQPQGGSGDDQYDGTSR